MRIAGFFVGGNFFVGLGVGWVTLGRRPGQSIIGGVFAGLMSLIFLVIASALVFSFLFIMSNLGAANMRTPLDLPLLMMQKSIGYIGEAARNIRVLIPLLTGGALTGLAAYQASTRWR